MKYLDIHGLLAVSPREGQSSEGGKKRDKFLLSSFFPLVSERCYVGRKINIVFCESAAPVVDKELNKSSWLSNKENSVSCLCDITNICQVHLEVISMHLCPSASLFQLGFRQCLCSALSKLIFIVHRMNINWWLETCSPAPEQLPCLLHHP